MLVNHLDGGQPWFIALVDYHGVNTPTMAISPTVINIIPCDITEHIVEKRCAQLGLGTVGSGSTTPLVVH